MLSQYLQPRDDHELWEKCKWIRKSHWCHIWGGNARSQEQHPVICGDEFQTRWRDRPAPIALDPHSENWTPFPGPHHEIWLLTQKNSATVIYDTQPKTSKALTHWSDSSLKIIKSLITAMAYFIFSIGLLAPLFVLLRSIGKNSLETCQAQFFPPCTIQTKHVLMIVHSLGLHSSRALAAWYALKYLTNANPLGLLLFLSRNKRM